MRSPLFLPSGRTSRPFRRALRVALPTLLALLVAFQLFVALRPAETARALPVPSRPIITREQRVKQAVVVRPQTGTMPAEPNKRAQPAPGETTEASFYSPALERTMGYWILLPPGHENSAARFPVLYMLHWRDGSAGQWRDLGLFAEAEKLMASGEIPPMIIVAPEGEFGYWMNQADGGPRWGDYVTTDLIGYIDATYPTIADKQHRAIGGISMGGHGALQLALNHPELFGVVGGHSAVFRRESEAFPFFGTGETYMRHDPVSLVRDLQAAVPFALWLDMGEDDPWIPSTADLHRILTERGIPHEWHVTPGGHDGGYWASHIPEYLRWYGAALGRG